MSLEQRVVATFTDDPDRALVGPPISGQILGRFGYLALSAWTGATLVVGSAVLAAARLRLDRRILAVV